MLFDLRARGRRRTVKVVYSGLALLLFVGLVFLGVGGLGGGVLEGVRREGGGGGTSFAARTAAAKKRIKQHPNEAAAWAALTEAQLHEAGGSEFYDSTREIYTPKGRQQLQLVASSWKRYLQLQSKHPSVKLARLVTGIFAPSGLSEPQNAIQALKIVIAAEPPSASLYSLLAEYEYVSHNFHAGDLASKRAVSLAPKAKRALMESEFERVKKAVLKASSRTAGTTGGAAAGTSGGTAAGTTGSGAGTTGSATASTSATLTSTSSSAAAGKKK